MEAMLGATVAAGLGGGAGPPAEANAAANDNGCMPRSKPQHSASVNWLRAALGLGPN